MKILLLGANGQLGWELQRSLAPLADELLTAGRFAGAVVEADLADTASLAARVRTAAPDVIVNAAAYTAVDRAESEIGLAHAVNAEAPAMLAQAAAQCGALLVHYSTDYVFDGSGQDPRDETARTAPLNAYGRTKLDGERAVQSAGCRHLILRTSWIHAARGGNFIRTILRLAAQRDRLNIVDDQVGAPTGAELVADVTAQALRVLPHEPALDGLYHCTASGEVSWHGYARFVVERARAHGFALRCQVGDIHPVDSSQYPTAAARPLNSRLSTLRLRDAFALRLPSWQSGVERTLREITGD